jgi:hypothetical protein
MTTAARLAHPGSFSASAPSFHQALRRPSSFQAVAAGWGLPSSAVIPAVQGCHRRWSLARPAAVGRSTGPGTVVAGTHNQSLERTRWAPAVRFADRQLWRAAQLQIR